MRKFSESLDNEIDAAYIRQCFADLIDSGAANVEEREASSVGKFVAISISQFETDRIISPTKEFISRNNSLRMKYPNFSPYTPCLRQVRIPTLYVE